MVFLKFNFAYEHSVISWPFIEKHYLFLNLFCTSSENQLSVYITSFSVLSSLFYLFVYAKPADLCRFIISLDVRWNSLWLCSFLKLLTILRPYISIWILEAACQILQKYQLKILLGLHWINKSFGWWEEGIDVLKIETYDQCSIFLHLLMLCLISLSNGF